MVGAAVAAGDDVVDFEVLGLEVLAASSAVSCLLAVEVAAVVGVVVALEVAEVGALRVVGSVGYLGE